MRKYRKLLIDITIVLALTVLLMFPYLTKSFLAIEHDTFFHVSRIEQYARALQHGQILPAIYPYENGGFGYGSPLFYSDIFLLLPAILHNLGLVLVDSYKLTVFLASFFSGITMYMLASKFTSKSSIRLLAVAAYLFSNYHITDIYVRGALGEVFALVGIPLILSGLYEIFETNQKYSFSYLIGLVITVLSHNLSFLLCFTLVIIICIIYLPKCSFDRYKLLVSESMLACLLTAFYTFPMIEQLKSQQFYLNYYASSSALENHAMAFWQFFANQTVFGLSGNQYKASNAMVVNIGLFLSIAPISYLFLAKKEKQPFITSMLVLGWICMLLPAQIFPWKYMSFVRVLQFPWRLNMLALPLLCVPAVIGIENLTHKLKYVPICLILLLSLEGIYHLYPATKRTFIMPHNTTWQEVTSGKLIDPYYSAQYMRVELAGGDYLPYHSPDFRSYTKTIQTTSGETITTGEWIDDGRYRFTITNPQTIVLPITYYKGYIIHNIDTAEVLETTLSKNGLVSVTIPSAGTYVCEYQSTNIRIVSIWISILTCMISIGYIIYHGRKKDIL
ncbi:MAG: hypothetical protein HXL46_02580 [Solobacterium sp.]|uniref:hypothetical protein n=1 Tax=Solobacterium sp. TaxID=2060878 RepID=UPI001CB32A4E|nr:hypothetical protein [Solobacterium sp.]MBF1088934.1 hypothetical protein [Solobacterium sp.]